MSVLILAVDLGVLLIYLILTVIALRGAVRLRGEYLWLLPVVLLALAANGVSLLAPTAWGPPVAIYLSLAMLVMFGALTSHYLKLPGRWLWPAAGGLWLLLVIGLDVVGGGPMLGNRVNEAIFAAPADILALTGWAVIGTALLIMAFYALYAAYLPEIANRALYWATIIPMVLLGVVLPTGGSPLLAETGRLIALAGTLGAVYGVSSRRVLDMRRALRKGAGLVAATLVTSFVILGALILAGELTSGDERDFVALGALALAVAALYVPLRHLTEGLARRLFGAASDPTEVLRQYSQRIASVIELDEVVRLARQTLFSVLRARPAGLLLAKVDDDGCVLLEPVQGSNGEELPGVPGELDPKGPIYRTLFLEQKPLLQYDIDFDRAYVEVTPDERAFFSRMQMSAYAPVLVDGQTIGVLAAGARLNDRPYDDADLQMLATIANQTGIALRNARLVDDLRRLNLELEEANANFSRLDAVKTDFITIASHELRTPLAQIRGYTDIIETLNDQGMLDPAQMAGMTANLRKAAERMEGLISAMLDVSKLDVDAMDLHFAPTTMEGVIRLAVEPLAEAVRSRQISLSARGLRALPRIEADMQRLVQAFGNVIGNAVKYTPDGGMIDIRAVLETRDDGPDEIHITVADTGIGIDPAHHELIFEKFFRVADPSLHSTGATKFMGAGPGLGLTIARGIIEGHGGRIWVESAGYDPEQMPGSTFHIILPLEPPENARRVLPFEETKVAVSASERAMLMQMVARAKAEKVSAAPDSEDGEEAAG